MASCNQKLDLHIEIMVKCNKCDSLLTVRRHERHRDGSVTIYCDGCVSCLFESKTKQDVP